MSYQDYGVAKLNQLITSKNGTWDGISAEAVIRMRLQNRFLTGLDIARFTAGIMREDMAAYTPSRSAPGTASSPSSR
jgi:isocitrate lyase